MIVRPRRKHEPGRGPHPAPIGQRIKSICCTLEDVFCLQRHGARTLHAHRAPISQRLLALTAAIALHHHLGRPSRTLGERQRPTAWNYPSTRAEPAVSPAG